MEKVINLLVEGALKKHGGCVQCAAAVELEKAERLLKNYSAPHPDQSFVRLKSEALIMRLVLLLPHECGKA